MKKIALLSIGCFAAIQLVTAGPVVSEADQKWLATVGKMVSTGRTEVSTPVESRTQLLKDWAKQNGYAVVVTKKEATFRVEFSKSLAKN